MRSNKGIVGATLLYGSNDPVPDLVLVMQFLVDDLRADDRRISGLRLGQNVLRLRADQFEIVFTLSADPLPLPALDGVVRPLTAPSDAPDMIRARLIHGLRDHRHALGVLVRPRGAPQGPAEDLAEELTRMGRLCLLPVIEAAPPGLVIWQPGSQLFTRAEFLAVSVNSLMTPPANATPLLISAPARQAPPRNRLARAPALPPPTSRHERAERSSAGRLFGSPRPHRPSPLPRLEATQDDIAAALRAPDPPPARRRHGAAVAVALMWLALLPQIAGFFGT